VCAEHGARPALVLNDGTGWSYTEFGALVTRMLATLTAAGVAPGERIAIFLPKVPLNCAAIYAASALGAVFVPVNPSLKPLQVAHILRDSGAVMLLTTSERARRLAAELPRLESLRTLLLTEASDDAQTLGRPCLVWDDASGPANDAAQLNVNLPPVAANALAALLYTSGSTGAPKGVMVTQRNFLAGCLSVSTYLGLTADDRVITALPFSFDYGLNQLLAALTVGAGCVLYDHLLANDLLDALERHAVTGLAGVPTLWAQLAAAGYGRRSYAGLRYWTNSGGALPATVLAKVRSVFPAAAPYLMYGLTEAFRSTYLPPDEVARRPGSIGKAIPGEEILVFKEDGTPAGPGEEGELVHCGKLVTQGYWRAADATRQRFKAVPGRFTATGEPEIGVWSGDVVRLDEDGYLYFIGRRDGLIKSSGYRVSPDEIEAVVLGLAEVAEVCAFGIPDEMLGQRIVLGTVPTTPTMLPATFEAAINGHCAKVLPPYMQPSAIMMLAELPKNMNGKYDRRALADAYTASDVRGGQHGAG